MAQLRIGCVVMAAGNARRFGENKLAVQVQGKALFHRALEAVPAEQFDRTVVVSQYPEVLELAHRMGFVPVPNRHPDWGISHTISLGLGKLPEKWWRGNWIMTRASRKPIPATWTTLA